MQPPLGVQLRVGRDVAEVVGDRLPERQGGIATVHLRTDDVEDDGQTFLVLDDLRLLRHHADVCGIAVALIINKERIADLPVLCELLVKSNVKIYADEAAYAALSGKYNDELLFHATEESFGTEFMSYSMAIKTVDSLEAAISHITENGSGHSECIITGNKEAASVFQAQVDAACVYVNAPTSFTDGAQFGLGAEIGISTQKLGPRGPMALEEITTYKWLIEGNGQIRP